ncbi:MAG: HD domain-containing protein [Anaerolineae bacterium]|nr:HD domain-containing protein [Anaerolineae bacterium]
MTKHNKVKDDPAENGHRPLSSEEIGLPAPVTAETVAEGKAQAEAQAERLKGHEVQTLARVESAPRLITIDDLRKDSIVKAFIRRANEQLKLIGYTEHGERHASLVANIAHNILVRLGRPARQADLAAMAGYLHDIGNVVHRENHAQTSALIAFDVLQRLGLDPYETALVMGAIGNHEEERGDPVSEIAAAIIIADKADVHISRVQNPDPTAYDIHDRVNAAATKSFVHVSEDAKRIVIDLTINTQSATIMEYFEIFLSRMVIARKAAQFLNTSFELVINGTRLY